MKYVGANDAFIRTPFFVEGMITGFFSGVGAFIITWLSYNSVYTIIQACSNAEKKKSVVD